MWKGLKEIFGGNETAKQTAPETIITVEELEQRLRQQAKDSAFKPAHQHESIMMQSDMQTEDLPPLSSGIVQGTGAYLYPALREKYASHQTLFSQTVARHLEFNEERTIEKITSSLRAEKEKQAVQAKKCNGPFCPR